MSKDMLGSIVRAAVSVPQDRGEVAAMLMSRLSKDHPQGGELYQQLDDLLAGRAQIVPVPLLSDESLHLAIPPEAYTVDWDAFQKRPDVYCYDGFKALIQEDQAAKPTERSISVGRATLQRAANGTAIHQELPTNHPLQLQEFIWTILSGGTKKDGRWHIGYVLIGGRVCVVDARWNSVDGQWRFDGWGLDVHEWSAGRRVLFSDSRPQTA